MSIKKYVIEKKIWFFSWWKWLFFALTLLFLLCLFLKCCTVKTSAANVVDPSINSVVEVPFKSDRLPDQPNRLLKIDTNQEVWRPRAVYHYIQDRYIKPDFSVDITEFWDKKLESIDAFSSQFFDPNSDEPETPISAASFMSYIEGRAKQFGREINAEYAEGFIVERVIGVDDILALR